MYCKKCGAPLDDDALFCSSCGQKVQESTQTIAKNVGQTNKKTPRWIGIVLCAVLAIVVLGSLSYAKNLHMSKKGVYDQLTSSYGEGFSADTAQYTIDHMTGVDWNANALEKAKQYYYNMSMSKSAVYDQLTSEYGEQFTASEAQYAIDHLS